MSDYLAAIETSADGMRAERLRLQAAAANIANALTVAAPDGRSYVPMRLVTRASHPDGFARALADDAGQHLSTVLSTSLEPTGAAPRRVHDPEHPAADAEGFVAYPGVNLLTEMTEIMAAVRAYEANLKAAAATRSMVRSALEFGAR